MAGFAVYAGGYSDMVAQRGEGVVKTDAQAAAEKRARRNPAPSARAP